MRSLSFDAKKTIKGKFKPSTAAEQRFSKQLRKVAQHAGHIIERHVDGSAIIDEKKMMDTLNKYARDLEPWAARQSAKLLEQVQKSNKRAYQTKSKAIGAALKLNVAEQDVGKVALKLLNEQVELITSIPIEAGLRAQKLAYDAVLEGTRAQVNSDTISEIEKQLGLSTEVATSRAKLIAITETARANASINQARAVAVGSNQYRWHNSGDAAVRHSHRIYKGQRLQGKIFSWDDPPTLSDGMKGHPGTFPRCCPGSSKIVGAPFIQKFYRHLYTGELTTLIFDDGSTLTATPNHPILGVGGFSAIDSFDVGQDIVGVPKKTLSTVDNDIKSFDITFEQVFNTLVDLRLAVKSAHIGGDFHGDVTDEKVDIVSLDCGLILETNSRVIQVLHKLGLADADNTFINAAFFGLSRKPEGLSPADTPASSGVSSIDLITSLLRAHFTPLDLFCFAIAPHINAGENEIFADDDPANSKSFCDLIFAYTLLIHGFDFLKVHFDGCGLRGKRFTDRRIYSASPEIFAQAVRTNVDDLRYLDESFSGLHKIRRIVEKRVGHFSIHVYNLQTVSGYYIAEDQFKMNCRCFAEPIFDVE